MQTQSFFPSSSGGYRDIQGGSEVEVWLHRCLQEPRTGLQVQQVCISTFICLLLQLYRVFVFRNGESYLSILDNMFLSRPSPLRELGDFESAMESFQKALMLDQNHIQSLQLRGMMLYHHGSLHEAIGNFKVL